MEKLPLSNARITASNVPNDIYSMSLFPRGNPTYVHSRSSLMEFYRNPRRWVDGYVVEETDSMDFGSIVDAMVSGAFEERYAVCPKNYTNNKGKEMPWNWNANACEAWRDERPDKKPVKHDDHAEALAAKNALIAHTTIKSLIECSMHQVMVMADFVDKPTGITVPIKALIDFAPSNDNPAFRNGLADLKTSKSANPEDWRRDVFKRNYHAQAALYLDVWNAATGEARDTFWHVVVENIPPFYVMDPVPMLSQEFIDMGRTKIFSALREYCDALVTGEWRGYRPATVISGFQVIEPLPFMVEQI